ncbi:MAG: hypothetical protein KR126chlam6_01137 [Candidatus Anoxychlamydiales bacterium]|nr:hypothetical protein [Candidatus Anoxychlamydiales bacterium]
MYESNSLETKIDIVQTALTYVERYPREGQDPKLLKHIIIDLKGDLTAFKYLLDRRIEKVTKGLRRL